MPLLKVEADKLSQNEMVSGIIEEIIERDDLFSVLPFTRINGKAYVYHRENTLPTVRNARIQINVWAATRIDATALMKQIEDAMIQASAFQARPVGALISASDPDRELRGAMQDFTVWATR